MSALRDLAKRLAVRAIRALPERGARRLAGPPVVIRGRTLDPWLQLLARATRRDPPLHTLTAEEARTAAAASIARAGGRPRALEAIEERCVPGAAGALRARLYRPHGLDGPRPLLLYFHQGGFVLGDLDACETFCSVIAETARCLVLSVAYRRGPEHRFPAAQEDALAVYRWALDHAGEVEGDPRRVAVGGDSAGAGLAAWIAQDAQHERQLAPLFQLLVYPWLVAEADNDAYRDFGAIPPLTRELMRWFLTHYTRDEADPRDPRLSPGLVEETAGLPPALVYTAGFDVLCDEGRNYAQRLEASGVPVTFRCYETLTHSFTGLGGAVPAAALALEEIARDVDLAIARGRA